jgi:hypothetical protein
MLSLPMSESPLSFLDEVALDSMASLLLPARAMMKAMAKAKPT